jgi:hypothetical protein
MATENMKVELISIKDFLRVIKAFSLNPKGAGHLAI